MDVLHGGGHTSIWVLGMIGNVSSFTGILILQGENDTKTPLQQAFLQQRLTDVNHPDHTLITYPGLGHDLSPAIGDYPGSSMYGAEIWAYRTICLADLYSWLEAHSGLSHPFNTPASTSGTKPGPAILQPSWSIPLNRFVKPSLLRILSRPTSVVTFKQNKNECHMPLVFSDCRVPMLYRDLQLNHKQPLVKLCIEVYRPCDLIRVLA
jgi:hypothetical protein